MTPEEKRKQAEAASKLTPLDQGLVRLARDRLCVLNGWLAEIDPPVSPRTAMSIIGESIRLHNILLGEGTAKDTEWLLYKRWEKGPEGARHDCETLREEWNVCQRCKKNPC
jgi:hypothetical protein